MMPRCANRRWLGLFTAAYIIWATGLWAYANPVPPSYPCCDTTTNTKKCEGCFPVPGTPGEWVLIPPPNTTYGCIQKSGTNNTAKCDDSKNHPCTTLDNPFNTFSDQICNTQIGTTYIILVQPLCAAQYGDTTCPTQ